MWRLRWFIRLFRMLRPGIGSLASVVWAYRIGRAFIMLTSVLKWPWKKILRVIWYVIKALWEALKENEENPLSGKGVKRVDGA